MSFLSVVVLIGIVGLLVFEIYKLVSAIKRRRMLKKQEKDKDSQFPDNSHSQKN